MINQEVFEKLLEIGGANLARRVIDLFFEHTPGKVQSLSGSLREQDCKAIERTAHSIKSSAANLGLEALRQVSSDLEQAANRGDLEACTTLVPQLETACSQSEISLRNKQKELESA
ncbi:MAG: Hpt domain-containing protein [Candidatus Sericytochromatia bacterium]